MQGRHVLYYTNSKGENPVKSFIESLNVKQRRKVARIISYLELYGLTAAIPHLKKLFGTPLWEIRVLGQDNIRIFYAIVVENQILLLHGFVKKSQQTPHKEIQKALKRLSEWNDS